MSPSSKRALQRQSFVCTKQRASQIYYYFPQLPPEKECFTKLRWFSMLNEYTAFHRDTQYPLPWRGKTSWIIHPLLLYLKLLGLKAKGDSFGAWSACFPLWVHFNSVSIPPRPSSNHMGDFLIVPLTLMRGMLSRKHPWKSQGKRQRSKGTISTCDSRKEHLVLTW